MYPYIYKERERTPAQQHHHHQPREEADAEVAEVSDEAEGDSVSEEDA